MSDQSQSRVRALRHLNEQPSLMNPSRHFGLPLINKAKHTSLLLHSILAYHGIPPMTEGFKTDSAVCFVRDKVSLYKSEVC